MITRRAFLSALAPLPEAWRGRVEEATALVRGNIRKLHTFPDAVLVEGARYPGIWLECGPHESLIWAQLSGETAVAEASHRIFYNYQKDDGQLPYSVKADRCGYSQIQMVVPSRQLHWILTSSAATGASCKSPSERAPVGMNGSPATATAAV